MQQGKTTLIKKDGGEMLIAIVLDKPLSEAQALVDNPDTFMLEITKIIQNKHAHPVIAQMLPPWCAWRLASFRMCPCLIRKSKQSIRKQRIARCLQRNFSKPYIRSTVNMGYPRLMVQHPAHAQPVRVFLHRSTVLLTNMGYPWLVCTPLLHCIQCNFRSCLHCLSILVMCCE